MNLSRTEIIDSAKTSSSLKELSLKLDLKGKNLTPFQKESPSLINYLVRLFTLERINQSLAEVKDAMEDLCSFTSSILCDDEGLPVDKTNPKRIAKLFLRDKNLLEDFEGQLGSNFLKELDVFYRRHVGNCVDEEFSSKQYLNDVALSCEVLEEAPEAVVALPEAAETEEPSEVLEEAPEAVVKPCEALEDVPETEEPSSEVLEYKEPDIENCFTSLDSPKGSEVKKVKKPDYKFSPIDFDAFQINFAKELIVGVLEDETFLNRQVAVVNIIPELFISGDMSIVRQKKYTIHKGFINHCWFSPDRPVSACWAVTAAMLELGSFTKKELLAESLKIMIEGDHSEQEANLLKSLETAFFNLKAHQSNAINKKNNFTFICDLKEIDDNGEERFFIRARKVHETLDFFKDISKKIDKSIEDSSPIVSVEVKGG